MPFKVNTFWNDKFNIHPDVKHCYYRITEVGNVPEVPGIYSWHLWIDNVNSANYSQVFKQKRVDVHIKSNLNDRFKGAIEHVDHEKDIFEPGIDLNLCNMASIAMCPPLYIGISKTLGSRLAQHVDEFDKIIKGVVPTPIDTLKAKQFDTIYESQHFAQRMGFVVTKFGNMNANNLLVKTLELPVGYDRKKLQQVETFLNRTYFPIYGRK